MRVQEELKEPLKIGAVKRNNSKCRRWHERMKGRKKQKCQSPLCERSREAEEKEESSGKGQDDFCKTCEIQSTKELKGKRPEEDRSK